MNRENKIEKLLALLKNYSEQLPEHQSDLPQKIIDQANALVQKKPKNVKLTFLVITTCAFAFGMLIGVMYSNKLQTESTELAFAEQQEESGLENLVFEEEVPIELEEL